MQLDIRHCARSVVRHRRTRLISKLLQLIFTSSGAFRNPLSWESQATYHHLAIRMGRAINLAQEIPWATEACTGQWLACNWLILFTVCGPHWRRETAFVDFEEYCMQRLQGCGVQSFRLVWTGVWLTHVLADQITVFWSQTRWICTCIPFVLSLISLLLFYHVVLLHTHIIHI